MRKVNYLVATLIFLLVAGNGVLFAQQNPAAPGAAPAGQAGPRGGGPPQPLKLLSPAFADGATLPAKYTCSAGQDAMSPPLRWMNSPSSRDMVTFALIVHDLEPRPRKGVDDILHWMVWNIPAPASELPEGISSAASDLPDGSHQTNGNPGQGGIAGYRPPCPPQNVAVPHHYVFELFALDTNIDLPPTATRGDVLKNMDGHIVAHAVLVAPFSR
jgi:Raf kinase inhibitor-like YbhB/YbcL family protein